MPAKSYPNQPIFADPSEKVVWQALVEQLPDDAVIVCNFKILEAQQEHEMDLIVLWSEVGVAVIEVKGGDITPNADATFTQRDAKGSREIDPMAQATKNMYELGRFIEKRSSIQHFADRKSVV